MRQPGLSDHALVSYDFGAELYPPTWRVPKFPEAPVETPTEAEQRVAIVDSEHEFQQLVNAHRIEDAWVKLSNLRSFWVSPPRGGAPPQ